MTEAEKKSSLPVPVPLAFLLCDQVITDADTKKKTLVGVFDRIWVNKFPTEHLGAALYARLIGAEGDYDIRVEYVQVDSQSILAEGTARMQVEDRHMPAEFSMVLPPLPIPSPGGYEFRLWMNERYIQRVSFIVAQRPHERRSS